MLLKQKINHSIKSKYKFLDDYICNAKTGIVKDVFQWLPEPDDPKVFLIAAITSNSYRFNNQHANTFNSGVGLTLKDACGAAIGESIERYSSSFINKKDLILSRYKDLRVKAVNPKEFAFYHKNQYAIKNFPFKEFTEDTLINWVECYSLTNKCNKLLPAATVFLPYKNDEASCENLIWYPVSTGLSCANNIEEATLKGIYEVIERDCFSILWFNKLEMPIINFNDNNELNEMYKKHFEIPNCKYHLVDMTMDVKIPSVLGILEDYSGGIMIAAATRLNLKDAVKKTFIELSQGRISWKKDFVEGIECTFKEDFSDIRDFHSRVQLFTKKNMKKHITFAYNSIETSDINNKYPKHNEDIKSQLNIAIKILKEKGYEVLVYDLTTPDIRQRGFNVVRVVIPGFTEITNDHVIPRAGGDRIYEVPYKLKIKSKKSDFNNLNPIPHPFP